MEENEKIPEMPKLPEKGKTIVYYPVLPSQIKPLAPKQQGNGEMPLPSPFTKDGFAFYVKQIILTFTTRKSLFSSKKIERFLVFMSFMTITVIYLALNLRELEALQLIEIIGLWLAYGGYNTYQNYRDKKIPGDSPVPDEEMMMAEMGEEVPVVDDPPPGDGTVNINF